MPSKVKKKIWGLISYKPRWGIAWRGWMLIFFAIALSAILAIFKLQPFLAYSQPIAADVLIVEGWLGDDALKGAIAEFNSRNYQLLVTTGIPLGRGEYLTEYKDFAHLSQASLINIGFDADKVVAVTTPDVERDRTLTSAVAVKEWLIKNREDIKAINVYSADVHSRRSYMLFRQVFEPEIKVGTISHPPLDYDARWWWASSQGVRKVLSESIGYVYALFL